MKSAEVGATVRTIDRGPPWIVVNHALESLVAAKWPGRLWRVKILKAASKRDNIATNYTRALAVRILVEEPVAQLFGACGDAVVEVLDKARTLDIEAVQDLSKSAG